MTRKLLYPALLLLLLQAPLFSQSGSDGDSAAVAELSQLNPSLVPVFAEMREALDRDDLARADSLLSIIVSGAPTFDRGVRYLGFVRLFRGDLAGANRLMEQAVTIRRSPENLDAYAECLAASVGASSDSMEVAQLALNQLHESRLLGGWNRTREALLLARLGLFVGSKDEVALAAGELMELMPDSAETHFYAAVVARDNQNWSLAKEEIEKAERLGMSHATTVQFLDSGVETNLQRRSLVDAALYVVALWGAGLLLLFGVGDALSVLALRSLGAADPNVPLSRSQQVLRWTYRMLINGAGIYYYLSLPVVIVLMVAVIVLVFAFFELFRVLPYGLLGTLGVAAFATIVNMIWSFFVKVPTGDPGRALSREEAPALWTLAGEVARDLGTRAVDEIRVTPGAEMAVYERGSAREKSLDRAQRILILGVANLNGFRQGDLRAILAHEYGHFAHRDTAGGVVALRVRNDMRKFFEALAQSGHATRWNIAVHFLRLYDFIFRRISHGAGRIQEILADRVAARTYGVEAFRSGLTHILRSEIAFNLLVERELAEAKKEGRPLRDLYELPPADDLVVDERLEETLQRPTSQDDTHPSAADRFALVERVHSAAQPPASAMAWELFADRSVLTRDMMALVEATLAQVAQESTGRSTEESTEESREESTDESTEGSAERSTA
jgi:hypothetical protein